MTINYRAQLFTVRATGSTRSAMGGQVICNMGTKEGVGGGGVRMGLDDRGQLTGCKQFHLFVVRFGLVVVWVSVVEIGPLT